MKKLILIVLLIPSFIIAQENIEIGIYQDFKLAFIGDDKGNDPFTPAFIFRFNMQGKQQSFGYMVIGFEIDYAELQGGTFNRYSVNVGYTLNKLYFDNWEANASINYGMIDRWNIIFKGFAYSGTLSYKIPKFTIRNFLFINYLEIDLTNFKLSAIGRFMHRKDKEFKYKNSAEFTINGTNIDFDFAIGVSYTITLN